MLEVLYLMILRSILHHIIEHVEHRQPSLVGRVRSRIRVHTAGTKEAYLNSSASRAMDCAGSTPGAISSFRALLMAA